MLRRTVRVVEGVVVRPEDLIARIAPAGIQAPHEMTAVQRIIDAARLLVIFIVAIIISLFRGLDINCGCFGTVDGAKVGLQKILENIP